MLAPFIPKKTTPLCQSFGHLPFPNFSQYLAQETALSLQLVTRHPLNGLIRVVKLLAHDVETLSYEFSL